MQGLERLTVLAGEGSELNRRVSKAATRKPLDLQRFETLTHLKMVLTLAAVYYQEAALVEGCIGPNAASITELMWGIRWMV